VKKVQNFDDNHSGSYAASFMSKAPEIVQQTENGATCFDSLYTENIILPQPVNLKEQGKSAKVKITISANAQAALSRQSSKVILTRENTAIPENPTSKI
jgi:hypothetical protein